MRRIIAFTLSLIVFGLGFPVLVVGQTRPTAVLLLTELYFNTPGDDSQQEWFEIFNPGTAVIDLSDVKVGDEETRGGKEGMLRFPEGATIAPQQVIVVAQTAVGFRGLYGRNPDYEIQDSDPDVPDMRSYLVWATGKLGLANDGDELLLLDADDVLLDAVNYGTSATYFSPSVTGALRGQSIARDPAYCDSDTATDWVILDLPTPGSVSLEGECRAPVNPALLEELPPIGAIQGRGDVAPLLNQRVSFRGVVTGLYEDRNLAGQTYYTLFVQDLPSWEDGDDATSDGVAIFVGRQRPSVALADQVRVTGLVTEFFGLTEIDDNGLEIQVEARDVPLPNPIAIDPPADNAAQLAYFEALEGMLVRLRGPAVVVGPTYSGCGFAVVAQELGQERVFRRRLEDPIGQVIPVLHRSDVDCGTFPHVKSGDVVTGLMGPLVYNFDQFKIVQQEPEALTVSEAPWPPPPAPPALAAGQFSIASFNFENHFDSIDDTGSEDEPKPSAEAIAVKQQKLAYAITETLGCPTLIGVQEVEKALLLEELATAVAPACGFTYIVSHLDSVDVRGIDVALLSDPRRAAVRNVQLRQTCTPIATGIADASITCPVGEEPLSSRPPLQVDLDLDGAPLTVIVNHFKSKRGGEQATAAQRLAQARQINALVAELLGQDEGARIVVLGDFNDYDQSPAMLAMTEMGQLTNVLLLVPEAQRYSFVFGGASQLIDGILVSPALREAVALVTIQHVNADYPDILGEDVSQAGLPYKATDHDLPLLVLNGPGAPPPPIPTPTAVPPAPPVEAAAFPWWGWLLGAVVAVGTAVFVWLRRGRAQ
jgi:uncharacterized protein